MTKRVRARTRPPRGFFKARDFKGSTLPRLPPQPGARDAEVVTRFVRFMDGTFGAGNWECRPGEPPDNAVLRELALRAFKAGAGVD